jgi:hypothetical protein
VQRGSRSFADAWRKHIGLRAIGLAGYWESEKSADLLGLLRPIGLDPWECGLRVALEGAKRQVVDVNSTR